MFSTKADTGASSCQTRFSTGMMTKAEQKTRLTPHVLHLTPHGLRKYAMVLICNLIHIKHMNKIVIIAHREATLSVSLALLYMLGWWLCAYTVPATLIWHGWPLWFLLSCLFNPLLFVALCALMVNRYFKVVALDQALATDANHADNGNSAEFGSATAKQTANSITATPTTAPRHPADVAPSFSTH